MPRSTHNKMAATHMPGADFPRALSPDAQPSMSFTPHDSRSAQGSRSARRPRSAAQAGDLSLYRSIFQQAFDGILIADGAWRVLEANPRACEMLGYDPDDIIGLDVGALLAPEQAGGGPHLQLLATLDRRHAPA